MIAHINEQTGEEQTVIQHLLGTAEIAEHLGHPLRVGSLSRVTALLHDLGKFRSAFEVYLRAAVKDSKSVKRGSVNHSSAGAIYIQDKYFCNGEVEQYTAQIIAVAIFSHHGLMDCMSADGKDNFHRRIDDRSDLDYKEVLENFRNSSISEVEINRLFYEAVQEVKGHLEAFKENKIIKSFGVSLLERTLLSILIDSDRLDTAIFCGERTSQGSCVSPVDLPWEHLSGNLELYLSNFQKNDKISILRTAIAKECLEFAAKSDGIYRLSVPTGGAKTLSSLRYAVHHARKYEKKRIFYIAPYLSILEQNSQVFRNALKDDSVILEHHSNVILDDDEESEAELGRYKHLTENWDNPIVLTTFVQFLDTLFSDSTQSVRRFHNLMDSVIIVDEIQSLPIHMISIFNMTMNYLHLIGGTTVILCSATQPILDQVKQPIYLTPPEDMIADKQSLYKNLKRVEIVEKKGHLDTQGVCKFALEIMKNSKSLLIILNTKSAVRKVFDELKGHYDESGDKVLLIHLSTVMCPQNRLDLISQMKAEMSNSANDIPVICVSTSLIEAGVDISFSCVIRSFAGLDSIAQAAGRCNRNGETQMGTVYLIHYNEEKLGYLKQIEIAAQCSEKIVDDYTNYSEIYDYDLLSPKAMDAFYQNYYYGQSQVRLMDYPIEKYHTSMLDLLRRNPQGVQAFIGMHQDINPNLMLYQAFKTAGHEFEVINQKTTSVLVPYREGKDIIAKLNGELEPHKLPKILRSAQRYTVNLYDNQMRRLNEKDALYTLTNGGILALKEGFYDEMVGLNEEGTLEFLEL
ncbi:MAG: CRISPR-associated helicase Cas3' [Clostridium sp.]